MRPQQQNRRMRGRNNSSNNSNNNNNNNNRRGPNPLTRNYESNGPDVKIRGSAQQIAEKYATLARDAHSSGDRVMSENYLQHAEHYNRIIAAAQAQMPIQNSQPQQRDEFDDDLDDDMDNGGGQDTQPSMQQNTGSGSADSPGNLGDAPQPVIEGTPAEVALNLDAAGAERQRANGFHNGNAGEGDEVQRRGRRRGRGRARFDEDRGDQAGEERAAQSAEAPAGEDKPKEAEVTQVERSAPEAADVDPVS